MSRDGSRPYGVHAQRAYDEIRLLIVTQRIAPREPITAAGYAEQLEMSRSPVREAILRLESEGLVRIVPRKGAFVRVLGDDEVLERYELAEALEGMIVFLATGRIDGHGLRALQDRMVGMEAALESTPPNMERWVTLDEEFHDIVNSYCRNRPLVAQRRSMQSQILLNRMRRRPAPGDKGASNADHRAIVEAMAHSDAEAARHAMQAHWGRIRREYAAGG